MRSDIRAVILTGVFRRHRYFIKVMSDFFDVVKTYTFTKSSRYMSETSEYTLAHKRAIIKEEEANIPDIVELLELVHIDKYELEEWVVNELIDLKLDAVLVFGAPIIPKSLIEVYQERTYNIHLGFSPMYRGSGTLFWAWKNQNLMAFSTTIHLVDEGLDTGNILYFVQPDCFYKNYYKASAILIKKTIELFPKIVEMHFNGDIVGMSQSSTDWLFYRRSDFASLSKFEIKKFLDRNDID